MIFLLNYERVRCEVAEITRARMADLLRIAPSDIEVTFQKEKEGEGMSSGWTLKALPEGVEPEKVKATCIEVAKWMRDNYLLPRLMGVKQTAREVRKYATRA